MLRRLIYSGESPTIQHPGQAGETLIIDLFYLRKTENANKLFICVLSKFQSSKTKRLRDLKELFRQVF